MFPAIIMLLILFVVFDILYHVLCTCLCFIMTFNIIQTLLTLPSISLLIVVVRVYAKLNYISFFKFLFIILVSKVISFSFILSVTNDV